MKKLVVFLLFCALWWFYLAQYMIRPKTYLPVTLWLVVALVAGFWHVRALRRFQHMVRAVRKDEELGLAQTGSTMFAVNQRFRYIVRSIENIFAVAIGAAGIYSVRHPQLNLYPWYQKLVLTFFIGSIAATGYLTVRDLRVINYVQKTSQQEDIALGIPRAPSWLIDKLRKQLIEEEAPDEVSESAVERTDPERDPQGDGPTDHGSGPTRGAGE